MAFYSLLLVVTWSFCAAGQGITYLNGTTARPGSNSKPTYSFPLAEVTALDYLYGGLSDSSLRLYCESAFLEASAQFQVPIATVTATSTVAGSLIPYTSVSTDYAASVTPKPPCCAECTISGNPAQLRYFPVTKSASSNGSITVSDNFTYTSPSIYLVLSSVRATNLCGAVGSESIQMVTLSFPPESLYTYAGNVGDLGVAGQQASSALFNPTDLAKCTTTETVPDIGPHFADPCSPFIVAPTQLLDIDPAFSTCTLAALGFHDPPTVLTPAKYLVPSPTPPPAPAASPTDPAPKITNSAGQQTPDPQPSPPVDDPSDPSSDPASDTPSDKPLPNKPAQNLPSPGNPSPIDPSPGNPSLDDPSPNDPSAIPPFVNPSPSENPQQVPGNFPANVGSTSRPQQQSPADNPIDAGSNAQTQPAIPGAVPIPVPNPSFTVGQDQHQPSIISVLGQKLTANPDSHFVGPSATLIPGGPPITISNTPVSLAASANYVVVGLSTYARGALPASAVALLPLGGTFISANTASQFIIGSQTLNPGGAVTVAGTQISLPSGASYVLVGSSTVSLVTPPAISDSPGILSFAGQIYTASPSNSAFVIAGQTLTPGSAITVAGTPISLPLGSSYALVGSSTVALIGSPVMTNAPNLLTFAGQTYTADSNNGAFTIGGQTITPGGAITVSGTRISLSPSATADAYAVIGSSTIPLEPATSGLDLLTFDGKIYTANSLTDFVIGGQTLTPGGAITVSGTRISLSPSATADAYAVIGSSTIPLEPATSGLDLLTFGDKVYTANSFTDFVIGGQTLTPGGVITVNGTPISLAPTATDAVVGTSTVGIGGYIMNGFNGAGSSGSGDNGSVEQFLGQGRGETDMLKSALRLLWLSIGVMLGCIIGLRW